MTLPVIDEHTDLDAAICDLRADQAELQRREQAINAEAYLRADKIRRAHEAQFKAQIDALKEKRRADHAELVRQCRVAKDALAAHESEVVKAQRRVKSALDFLENVRYQVAAHTPLNPNDWPLPEETAAWNEAHGKLQAAVAAAEQPYSEALGALKPIQAERDRAADTLRELAGRELAARQELQQNAAFGRF